MLQEVLTTFLHLFQYVLNGSWSCLLPHDSHSQLEKDLRLEHTWLNFFFCIAS